MPSSTPKVSIGLPVYNGEQFLESALNSLLSQTFGDFELIISDNASTGRTKEIAQSIAAKDSRVRYYRNLQNIGLVPNFNRTAAVAEGEYFMWAAHDDLWSQEYLERCVMALDKDEQIVVACTLVRDIDENGSLTSSDCEYRRGTISLLEMGLDSERPSDRFKDLIRLEHLCEPVVGLIRASVLKSTQLHPAYADGDRVLLAELGLRGRFHVVPEALFFHREHKNRSVRLHPERYERAVWMDPTKKGKILLPHFRELLELARSVEPSHFPPRYP